MRKIDRQPKPLMSTPPMAGPSAGAANSSRPALAGIDLAPVLLSRSSPIASGTIGAPASPWTTRATISSVALGAAAQAAEARTKPGSAAWRARIVPKRRASHGVAASPQASPSRYPLTVQAAVDSEVCSSRTITGTATFTTDESIIESIGPPRKASRVAVLNRSRVSPPWLSAGRGPSSLASCGRLELVQPGQLVAETVHAEVQDPQSPLELGRLRPQPGQVRDRRIDDRAPSRDDLEPVAGLEVGEERDPHLELVLVGQQGWVGVADHRLQQVVTGVGEPVHVARRAARICLGGDPLDRPLLLETPQRGIEHIVVDRPPAQDPLDALLDLIAVLRSIGEHSQDHYAEVHAVRLIYSRLTRKMARGRLLGTGGCRTRPRGLGRGVPGTRAPPRAPRSLRAARG